MSKNIYNQYGVNINNEPMFYEMEGYSKQDKKILGIRAFSSSSLFLKILYTIKGFKLNRIDDKKLVINYKNDSVQFSLISDNIESDNCDISEVKKELLDHRGRVGQCHNKSMEFINLGDYLVTGYVDDTSRDYRVIHSWIETEKVVIDYTSNLVMKKEDYYELRNVEVLSVINKNDMYSDSESDLKMVLGCKFYCLFRDELFNEGLIQFGNREIVKNKHI